MTQRGKTHGAARWSPLRNFLVCRHLGVISAISAAISL
jgi:hypothetical protein